MKTAWVTASELAALMVSEGFLSSVPADPSIYQDYIDAAVREWETTTGYQPFLGETVDSETYFDPPDYGKVLELRTGYISITSIEVGLSYTVTSSTALTAIRDYNLRPHDARARYEPYHSIEFYVSLGDGPRSIKITGKRGYDDEIHEDAWLAVAYKAIVNTAEAVTSHGAILEEIKEGPVTYKFGDMAEGGSGDKLSLFRKHFAATAAQYERITF